MSVRYAKRPTHAESRERRKLMAQAVKSGILVKVVAMQFDVTPSTVREACKEHGVQLTWKCLGPTPLPYRVLGRVWQGKDVETVAREMGISVERVESFVERARAAGIPVP